MKKTLELTKPSLLIAVILLMGATMPASLAQGLPGSTSPYSTLIDINFGAHQSPGLDSNKVGLAATGLTVSDFWNFYSRDDGQGHWLVNGVLPNLRFTDGSASSAGLIVSNAPGCWADGSSDSMYNTYLYPFDGGNTTVTVMSLVAGQYDFYVYGPNGNYQLTVGSTNYGLLTAFDWPVINPTVWQEGRQYVVYRGVPVGTAQTVTLTVLANACGSLGISGMQIGSATVIPTQSCAVPPAGLVSWWRAEGSGSDSAGSNNAVLLNGASFAPGMVGAAFSVNGSNQCVQVPFSSSLIASNYSIEAWVKPLAQVSDFINQDLIFGQNFGQCQLLARTGSTGVRVAFAFGTSHDSFFEVAGTSQIPIGQFSHLAGTWDGTTLRLYINGVLNAQSAPGASPVNSGCPFFIGGFYSPAADSCGYVGQFFNGLIDEVSYYKRSLSAAEIQSIYQANGAGKCAAGAAPTITAQPTNQTVQTGSSVTFTVTDTGTPPLGYQWRFNGTNILAAAATALTLTNVQLAQAGSYSVRVTNLYGSATSSNAVLTVNPAGACVPPPAGLVGWWRAEANAEDQAGTNNGTLVGNTTYGAGRVGQAFVFDGRGDAVSVGNPTNLQLQNFTIEAWIKRANRSLASFGGEGAGHIFGGSYGGYVFGLWDDGQLTLGQIGISGVESARAMTDTNGFHHVAVTKNGGNIVFYVDGAGETAAAYDPEFVFGGGFVIGARGGDYGASILGSLDEVSVYNRPLSAAEIQAIYSAGGAGKCTEPKAPFINSQPASQTVSLSGTVTFTVMAGGQAPLSYQWRFNGTNIVGATATAFTLTNVQLAQAGSYTVRITNQYGSATSSNAVLTVNPAVTCAPPPSGMVGWWRSEGNALDSFGTNSGVLHNGVGFANGEVGQVFDFNGTDSYVEVPDSPALRLTNQMTIEAWINARTASGPYGNALVSKVGGAGGNNGYQFYLDGNTLVGQFNSPGEVWPSASVSSGGIIVTGVWYHVAWTYDQAAMKLYCNGQPVATNVIGAKSIAASSSNLRLSGDDNNHVYFDGLIDEASVYNRALSGAEIAAIYNAGSAGKCAAGTAPSITVQPASQTVGVGSNVTFTVAANGTAPLSYQWWFNGTNLAGATTTTLVLANVQRANAGNYSVRVANAFGSILSSNVTLTVIQATPQTLINVDFGAGPATSGSPKTGPAVVGQATNDFWNFYTRDDDSGVWRTFGVLSNLKFANGAVSSGGMTVLNAPGAWADGSSDSMYDSYINPFDGANVTVTVTNLAVGQYDFYVYGPDGNYQLAVGPTLHGVKTTLDQPLINPPSWQEGRQYALYRGVSVGAGQGVILTVRPGVYGYAIISGMQIASPVAASQPQRQTALLKLGSVPSTSGGSRVQLEFLGAPNRVYVFQASTTLTEWMTIGLCVTDAEGSATLTDPDAGEYPARLYRVVAQ